VGGIRPSQPLQRVDLLLNLEALEIVKLWLVRLKRTVDLELSRSVSTTHRLALCFTAKPPQPEKVSSHTDMQTHARLACIYTQFALDSPAFLTVDVLRMKVRNWE